MTPEAVRRARWRPSTLGAVATAVAVALTLLAVLARRADLAVTALPLLAVVGATGADRPRRTTEARVCVERPRLTEGASTDVEVVLDHDPRAEVLGLDLALDERTDGDEAGTAGLLLDGERTLVRLRVAPQVWGSHLVGHGELRLSSPWALWTSSVPDAAQIDLVTLPSPTRVDAAPDGALAPAHLIGRHVSPRTGDGAEFAEIRAYRPGDRVRHIHWPTSARTGELHVRTTYAERDAQVLLLVDVLGDLPDESPRRPSAVERAVQAAAHVAGHLTVAGDRVGLLVVGDASPPVPAASGRRHLQRILTALARVDPATDRRPDVHRLEPPLPPGALVVAFTPLTSRLVVDALVALTRRRVDVAVVDVVPPAVAVADPDEALALRLLRLERDRTVDLLEHAGVPVVPWDGARAVDLLLRRLQVRRQGARP